MSIQIEWQIMTVEIVPFQDKYSNYFYDLNYDWLNEYFYVEDYDEKVLRNCKEEIIDKTGLREDEVEAIFTYYKK